ncbi:MAG: cytochrome c [Pseudomonadota bacterium]
MESNEIRKTRQIDKKTKRFLISGTVVSAMLAGAFGWLYFDRLDELAQDAEAPLQIDWMFIDAGDADLVIEGRKVYEANCADCHGFRLEGQPNWQRRGPDGVLPAPPHDETGHTWHHPDAGLFATTKLGGQAFMPQGVKSGMPAYRDILSDREIEAALAYIKSRWPGKIRRQHEMRTNQSR